MDFVKMEGLGNDFIVVEAPFEPDPVTIAAWCDRRFGIGADGVLEVGRVARDRISMRYWNADGHEAEMCGNGMRCLASLAVRRRWVDGNEMTVETASGDLPAQVLTDGQVRALVGLPRSTGDPLQIEGVTVHPVSVGNPHAVTFVDDPDAAPVGDLGPRIERHEAFPDRTNVEFVTPTGAGSLTMRIWERGVGETMASGSGASAAAYAAVELDLVTSPVMVSLPGGALHIDFDDAGAWMTGPGNLVFEGTLPD